MEKFLCIAGVEVANACRTQAYLANLGNKCQITCGTANCCSEAFDDGPYLTPADDDAPWFDPSVPESADVLGVLIEDITVSTPLVRDMTNRLWGGALGPKRYGGREIVISGWIYTRTCQATDYARQWLFEALNSDVCSTTGCDGVNMELYNSCGVDGLRSFKNVGLTDFQWDTEPDYPCYCGAKFEATFSAEIPWAFMEPSVCYDGPARTGDAVCVECNPCPTREPKDCTCGCVDSTPRVVETVNYQSCFCPPDVITRVCCDIVPPRIWGSATMVATIYGGTAGLKNMRIKGFANPLSLPADHPQFDCAEPCILMDVECIPPGGTLTIDGTVRKAKVDCDGVSHSAFGYLSADGRRFGWPDTDCTPLLFCVEADWYNTPDDATVTLQLVGYERG
jgi:hypothetical protein